MFVITTALLSSSIPVCTMHFTISYSIDQESCLLCMYCVLLCFAFLSKYYDSSIVGSRLYLIAWSTLLDVLVLTRKHNFNTQYILWLPSHYEFLKFSPFNLRIIILDRTSDLYFALFQKLVSKHFSQSLRIPFLFSFRCNVRFIVHSIPSD